jgi:AraC-like DNA-binding protein
MSRARFAAAFRETLGQTPGDYLTQWRISLAQSLLLQGRPTDWVAHAVGYSGPPALAKVFRQSLGLSPTQWLKSSD